MLTNQIYYVLGIVLLLAIIVIRLWFKKYKKLTISIGALLISIWMFYLLYIYYKLVNFKIGLLIAVIIGGVSYPFLLLWVKVGEINEKSKKEESETKNNRKDV